MNELIARFNAWWSALEAGQKLRLGGVVAVTLAAVVALSVWASRTSWQAVVTDGSYDDLLAAAAALEEREIPYKIRQNGRLDVPASRLGSARAAISSSNVLPGLADVSELKLGLTPRAQEWALLRAREGDLARMVNGIDGVAASQVQIVPRQDAFFLDDERPARASVFVRLNPGADLGNGQVRAIQSLVASAVDGLDPENVTIADDRGTLLARGQVQSASGGDPSELLEYRRELEAEIEGSVVQALLPVLGSPAFFSATATVELDLSSSETVSKQVSVQEQAVISEQIQESQTSRSDARGVPGVDANLPERGGAGDSAQASERSALVTNYVYPTVDEIKRRPAGGVDRISVAVQVDEGRVAQMVAALGPDADAEALRQAIEVAVKAAVSADLSRGDVVQVSYLPFVPAEWEAPAEAGVLAVVPESVLPWAVAGVAVVLAFLFVVRPIMASATTPIPPEAEEEEEEEEEVGGRRNPDHDLADKLVDLVENFEPIDNTMLNQLVENQSMAAAQVLRQWNRSA